MNKNKLSRFLISASAGTLLMVGVSEIKALTAEQMAVVNIELYAQMIQPRLDVVVVKAHSQRSGPTVEDALRMAGAIEDALRMTGAIEDAQRIAEAIEDVLRMAEDSSQDLSDLARLLAELGRAVQMASPSRWDSEIRRRLQKRVRDADED